MATRDGRLHIVYNGEIYNYRALRKELEAAGHVFESSSDTETLLLGYRQWGTGLLDRLRGMFAFALYDAETRQTFLARDPLGIKPLYYADEGGRFLFASEVQALRTAVHDQEIDPEGVATFLCWGSIAPPRTLHRKIRALPPGAWIQVGPGRIAGPGAAAGSARTSSEAPPPWARLGWGRLECDVACTLLVACGKWLRIGRALV